MYDFVIAGGGLAGVTLAYRLIESGSKVMVLDTSSQNISSSVAAGIFNPVTGKRLVLSWMAETLYPEIFNFYPKVEQQLEQTFFYPMPLYRVFETQYEQNEGLTRLGHDKFKDFAFQELFQLESDVVNQPFGAIQMKFAGRLDLQSYVTSMQNYLKEKQAFLQMGSIDFETINLGSEVEISGIKAAHLVFCDGAQGPSNPYFNFLPWKTVHGELLEIEMEGFYMDSIITRGIFIVPSGPNRYFVGATYNWDLKQPILTESGLEELLLKLKSLINLPFKVINHKAGIRPATNDRRPFLGSHPQYSNLHIFGGLGSKGVSLAPYLSLVFADYLLNATKLPAEMDICRFKN
jgi:glycine/D-amino acid oxidase-like deaminating enzyme